MYLPIIAPKLFLFNTNTLEALIVNTTIEYEDHHQQVREELHTPEGAVPPLWD